MLTRGLTISLGSYAMNPSAGSIAAVLVSLVIGIEASAASDDAAMFGALETVNHAALSPDGSRIVYTGPGSKGGSRAVVVDPAQRTTQTVARANDDPLCLSWCGWAADNRLVCQTYGLTTVGTLFQHFTRLFAMNADGGDPARLGERESSIEGHGLNQEDAIIIDWLSGVDTEVLIARQFGYKLTPVLARDQGDGLGVVRVDTRSLNAHTIEKPNPRAIRYISDGHGNVRLMTLASYDLNGRLDDVEMHYYRRPNAREWELLGTNDMAGNGIDPVGVDSNINAAYVMRRIDGRWALHRIALDGSMQTEVVLSRSDADIDEVETIGRGARIIGATFVTKGRQVEYFDPIYHQLAASLAKALPSLPSIRFVSSSADEQKLLVGAHNDVEPGRYYLFDRKSKHLEEALLARPELDGVALALTRSLSYPAADGTMISAYLTVPQGIETPSQSPAIVMPRGGPAARDEAGFDWLAQFFARQGFVVMQPNFRGSEGYHAAWFDKHGFQDWKTAVGDVTDSARWLAAQGLADPRKIAVLGWSFGGYAALQSNVVDPDLFRAVVAIAPVTDFGMLKQEFRPFTSSAKVAEFIGSGAHVEEGSPARHADRFKAPVLIFHGGKDRDVAIDESRAMDAALRQAGKQSELVVYEKLDHGLLDGESRADLLRRADAFLRSCMNR
jgi:dipeptidyl aminopeptidase/acylaminoacyl peptidase